MSPKVFALGILGFGLIAIIALGIFFESQPKIATPPETEFTPPPTLVSDSPITTTESVSTKVENDYPLTTQDDQQVGTLHANISYEGSVTSTVTCGTQSCFEENFKTCSPATVTTTVSGLGGEKLTIVKKVSGGCQVTFRYTEVANPAWVNQDLTCTYDNTLSFQNAFQKVFETAVAAKNPTCSGPLYTIFKNMNSR